MKTAFFAAVALTVGLAGCFDDQKQKLLACQLDAERTYPITASDTRNGFNTTWDGRRGAFLRTCMEAGGYEWSVADDRCTVSLLSSSDATIPYCYRPRDWLGRAAYIAGNEVKFCGAWVNPFDGSHGPATTQAQAQYPNWCKGS
jgi:hypothetical protein